MTEDESKHEEPDAFTTWVREHYGKTLEEYQAALRDQGLSDCVLRLKSRPLGSGFSCSKGASVYPATMYEGDPFISMMVVTPECDHVMIGIGGVIRFTYEKDGKGVALSGQEFYPWPWLEKSGGGST